MPLPLFSTEAKWLTNTLPNTHAHTHTPTPYKETRHIKSDMVVISPTAALYTWPEYICSFLQFVCKDEKCFKYENSKAEFCDVVVMHV